MPQITLVQYPGTRWDQTFSPPCAKVRIALAYKKLEFETKNVATPGQAKRYNPRGRVPTLIIDEERIVDSTDILSALESRFPEQSIQPPDPALRAPIKIMEDWADEVLYFYLVYLRWMDAENFGRFRALTIDKNFPPVIRSIVAYFARREVRHRMDGQGVGLKGIAVVRRELERCLDDLEAILGMQPFVVGESFSRADISIFAVIEQLLDATINPIEAGLVERRPIVMAWCERIRGVLSGEVPPEAKPMTPALVGVEMMKETRELPAAQIDDPSDAVADATKETAAEMPAAAEPTPEPEPEPEPEPAAEPAAEPADEAASAENADAEPDDAPTEADEEATASETKGAEPASEAEPETPEPEDEKAEDEKVEPEKAEPEKAEPEPEEARTEDEAASAEQAEGEPDAKKPEGDAEGADAP